MIRSLVVACASVCLAGPSLAADPQLSTARSRDSVPGLKDSVELVRDKFGLVHIYAKNDHDLFFAQGYSAARDRLFQLEIWRRQAMGETAEILGARGVTRDVGARLLRFRGDMAAELAHYHPRGAAIVNAFVDGVNAYITRTEREPRLLPIEFAVLGIKPGRWSPEVVVSRHNGLYGNLTREVRNARLVHVLGPETAANLLNLHPGNPSLEPNPKVDLGQLPPDVLDLYQAYRAPVVFEPEDVVEQYRARSVAAAKTEPAEILEGSNNWVIAPERSFTGSAIMANDPHRAVGVPSLRYWVHLVAPEWNVIGGGEPALPGVSVGHNARGAWGFTIFPMDQEDLFVLETDPADPTRYRANGRWERMRQIEETIKIKDREPAVVRLHFSRFGPVLKHDAAAHRAYALKAVWHEVGTAPYLASLRIDQAPSWDAFREACRWFLAPDENMVWADRAGQIGWQVVGRAPIRQGYNGLLPAPGDGTFDWKGTLDPARLPSLLNPPQGWFATANQDNLPRGYPFAVGYEWTDPYRFSRIEEVLAAGRKVTLADMIALQQDYVSIPARALCAILLRSRPIQDPLKDVRARLAKWDGALTADSPEAALYVSWEHEVRQAVWRLIVHPQAREILPWRSLSVQVVIQALETPDGRFGADPIAARDLLLHAALGQAVKNLRERMAPAGEPWPYGHTRFKHVFFKHPLSDAVEPRLRARLELGPLPRGGSAHTVNATSDSDNQTAGASFRIIADTGDWDRSLGTNTPGQSGDPASPHYRDLFEPWTRGDYFPIFFSRAKVDSVAESVVQLAP